jgi:hypothetical protein
VENECEGAVLVGRTLGRKGKMNDSRVERLTNKRDLQAMMDKGVKEIEVLKGQINGRKKCLIVL